MSLPLIRATLAKAGAANRGGLFGVGLPKLGGDERMLARLWAVPAREEAGAIGQVQPSFGQAQQPSLVLHIGGPVGQFHRLGGVDYVIVLLGHAATGPMLSKDILDL